MNKVTLLALECLKKLDSKTYTLSKIHSSDPLETVLFRDSNSLYKAEWRGNTIGLVVITAVKLNILHKPFGVTYWERGGDCWDKSDLNKVISDLMGSSHSATFRALNGDNVSEEISEWTGPYKEYIRKLQLIEDLESRYCKLLKDMIARRETYWL